MSCNLVSYPSFHCTSPRSYSSACTIMSSLSKSFTTRASSDVPSSYSSHKSRISAALQRQGEKVKAEGGGCTPGIYSLSSQIDVLLRCSSKGLSRTHSRHASDRPLLPQSVRPARKSKLPSLCMISVENAAITSDDQGPLGLFTRRPSSCQLYPSGCKVEARYDRCCRSLTYGFSPKTKNTSCTNANAARYSTLGT